MVSLVAAITVLLVAVRVFVAVVVETAFVYNWPLVLANCPTGCVGKSYPDLCLESCKIRTKIGLDMKDYFAIDPVTENITQTLQGNVMMTELTFITTPLMVLVVFGLLARANWAKKLGLVLTGTFIQMMWPAVYLWFQVSPNPPLVLAYNAADLALTVFLLIWSWRSPSVKQPAKSDRVVPPKKSKKTE